MLTSFLEHTGLCTFKYGGALWTGKYLTPSSVIGLTVLLVIGMKSFPLTDMTVVIFYVTFAGTTLFLNTAAFSFGIAEIGM